MSAEKVVICNVQELSTTPPGWCLETIIRDTVKQTVIAEAIGDLADTAPQYYRRAIRCIESPQMNPRQQEFMRRLLQTIYIPVEDWADDALPPDDDD